jgi:hypothetical protein
MMLVQLVNGRLVSIANRVEQFFGLTFQLLKIGAYRKVTIVKLLRHTDLLYGQARSPQHGRKRRFVRTRIWNSLRWTRSSPRTGGVLHAEKECTRRSMAHYGVPSAPVFRVYNSDSLFLRFFVSSLIFEVQR